jgi:hypothetical protein
MTMTIICFTMSSKSLTHSSHGVFTSFMQHARMKSICAMIIMMTITTHNLTYNREVTSAQITPNCNFPCLNLTFILVPFPLHYSKVVLACHVMHVMLVHPVLLKHYIYKDLSNNFKLADSPNCNIDKER